MSIAQPKEACLLTHDHFTLHTIPLYLSKSFLIMHGFETNTIISQSMRVHLIFETPVSVPQDSSTAPQTTACKINIKLNQHLYKTVATS